jgi:hypothetical protein
VPPAARTKFLSLLVVSHMPTPTHTRCPQSKTPVGSNEVLRLGAVWFPAPAALASDSVRLGVLRLNRPYALGYVIEDGAGVFNTEPAYILRTPSACCVG